MRKIFTYFVRVGTRFINLVDGKHHRHISCLSMRNSLARGRHHTVVGRNDDNRDIGNLCSAGTHSRKCFVSRGIQESDTASVFELHVVSTDVLSDSAGLTRNDIGLANVVEQRCLTVIHVSHHRYDGRARYEFRLVVGLFGHGFRHFGTHVFSLEAELFGNKIDCFGIQALIDRHHNADTHQRTDNLIDRYIHHRCKFADGDKLRELQRFAVFALGTSLFVELLLHGIALLFAVFRTLFVLILFIGKPCQRLLYLACYILFVHFQRLAIALAVLAFLTGGIFVCGRITGIRRLIGRSIDIYALLVDTNPLLTLASCLSVFLFTLFPPFFFRLLLRPCTLVDCIEIDFSEYVYLGRVEHRLLTLQLENSGAGRLVFSRFRYALFYGFYSLGNRDIISRFFRYRYLHCV